MTKTPDTRAITDALAEALAPLLAPDCAWEVEVRSFHSVCDALDAIPEGPGLDDAVAAVDAAYAGREHTCRYVPERWTQALITGNREPRVAAARALRVRAVSESALEHLTYAPELTHVRWLTFMNAVRGFKPKFLRPLGMSPWMEKVEHLALRSVPVQDSGLGHLCRSKHLRSLKWLVLSGASLKSRSGQVLASTETLRGLRALSLSMNALGDDGAGGLARAEWPALEELDLDETQLTHEGVGHLARSRLPALRKLDLHRASLGAGLAAALRDAPWLATLEHITLTSCGLTGVGWPALLERIESSALHSLDLGLNYQLGPSCAGGIGATLARSRVASQLRLIGLSACGVGDDDVRALANADLPELRELRLSNNPWTDAAAEVLARSPLMTQLRVLWVPRELSDRSRAMLREAMTTPGAYFSAS